MSKTMGAKPRPVFCLSKVSLNLIADRDDLFAAINELGGSYLYTLQYEPICTHLIIKTPASNEKYLAAGKWVLHPQYLTDSLEAGHFLPETLYEWGNMEQAASFNSPGTVGTNAVLLALAAHGARIAVASAGKKAFDGWRVVIAAVDVDRYGYGRLLEAGGAKIITHRPPYFTRITEATHFLHEEDKVKLCEEDLSQVPNVAGVAYHSIVNLVTFLVESFVPPVFWD